MLRLLFSYLLTFVVVSLSAQIPDPKWSRSCGTGEVKCLLASVKLKIEGVSKDVMAERIDKFLKDHRDDEDCTYTDATVDDKDYNMCWGQSEKEKRGTKVGRYYSFHGRRRNSENSRTYDMFIYLLCSNDELAVNFTYFNDESTTDFYKDREGNDNPLHGDQYRRFWAMYEKSANTLINAVSNKSAVKENPGKGDPTPENKTPVRRRLNN